MLIGAVPPLSWWSSRGCVATDASGRALPAAHRGPAVAASPAPAEPRWPRGATRRPSWTARAIATRQIERGRLDDEPGATAHEVAARLAASYPEEGRGGPERRPLRRHLYGDRPATGRRERGARARRHPGRCPMSFLARHRTTDDRGRGRARRRAHGLARPRRPTYAGALDPQNPGGDGAQALARVLDSQGVSVDVVRSAAAFDRATTDSSTMVVVTAADRLGRSTTRRLLDHQGEAGHRGRARPELTALLDIGSYAVTTAPHDPVPAGRTSYVGLALQVPTAEAFDTDGASAPRAASSRRAAAGAHPARRLGGPDQRPDPRRRQRGRGVAAARPAHTPGLVRPVAHRPRGPRRGLPPACSPLAHPRPVARPDDRRGLVVWRSRRLGHWPSSRCRSRSRRSRRPQPRPPLPPGRRPGPCGGGAEVGGRARLTERLRLPRHTDHAVLARPSRRRRTASTRSTPCSTPMPSHPRTTTTWPTWPAGSTSSTERCHTHERPQTQTEVQTGP